MANTPTKGWRFDENVLAAFIEMTEREGTTPTADLENYMSRRTGVPVSKKRPADTKGTECPFCKAKPGTTCVNHYTGKPVKRPHPERIEAAQAIAARVAAGTMP